MTLQHPGIIVGYAGFDLRTSASKSGAIYQWATTSPFIIIFYAYCRQFAQLFPPGQASVNFLDHVFRSLKETVSRQSECNKVDDLKDLDCGFLVYLSNQNVYSLCCKTGFNFRKPWIFICILDIGCTETQTAVCSRPHDRYDYAECQHLMFRL